MIMKKAFAISLVTLVFLFSMVGFFNVSQDDHLLERKNISVVHASDEVGKNSFNDGNAPVPGFEDDNLISKSSFAILGSSLILMLLIRNKAK
jgi:hypothetical protein